MFAVIDPTLRWVTGHEYEYTKLVLEASANVGYQVQAWGGNDAVQAIQQEPWFVPAFSKPMAYRADVTGPISLAIAGLRWAAGEMRWYRELRTLLDRAELKRGDKVFVHTIHNPSIWQWRLAQDWFEKHGVDLFLFFRVSRRTVPRGLRRFFDFFYRGIGVGRSHIHFLTDTEGLRQEYQSVSPRSLTVVGLPVDPALYLERIHENGSRRPVIASIGNARSEKGFHLMPELVRLLNGSTGFEGVFRIQCTFPQGGLDLSCRAAYTQLQRMRNKWNNIELVEEDLSLPQYRQMLRNSDVFVFPYEAERYRTATSNILGQVLALGKACVVPAGTWLADSVKEVGYGEVSERTPQAFAAAVNSCLSKIRRGLAMCPKKQAQWRAKHSPQGIVAELERLADPSSQIVR